MATPLYPPINVDIAQTSGPLTVPWRNFFQSLNGNLGPITTAITQLTGDVTAGPGPGSVTATLAPSGVTPGSYTSADITVDAKGRVTAASNGSGSGGTVTTTGSPAAGNLTKFSGATSITNADLTGDVTTAGGVSTTIATNAVTNTKFRQSAALSLVGRSANSTGNVADISSSAVQQIVVNRSSVLTWLRIDAVGYWSPLTNGDPVTPELIFDGSGDTIAIWTDL